MLWAEHKSLNGNHISKVATLGLRIVNIQIIHCMVRLMFVT